MTASKTSALVCTTLTAATLLFQSEHATAQRRTETKPLSVVPVEGVNGPPAKIAATITAGTKDKKATISLDLIPLFAPKPLKDGTFSIAESSLNLSVSTPWDGSNDAIPASLDGLASGTSAKLTWGKHNSARLMEPTEWQLALEARAITACKNAARSELEKNLAELGPEPTADAKKKVYEAYDAEVKKCDIDVTDTDTLVEAARKLGEITDREARRYYTEFFKSSSDWGVTAKVGYDKFDFVDPITLTPDKRKKTSYAFGGFYTHYLKSSPAAVSVSAEYEGAWKGADKVILCPVATGPNPVQCINKAPSPPTFDKSVLFKLNWRQRLWKGDSLSGVAIAPTVTYDALDNEFGVELPIYIIPNADDGLTGGVKIGYETENKDLTFGIFVGAAFGVHD